MTIINWANYDPNNVKGEINNSPSLTVPGMTLSLKQLLERFVRGESVTTFQPVYLGDDSDMPDLSRMDTIEKIEMAAEIKAAIRHHQNRPKPPQEAPPPEQAPPVVAEPQPSGSPSGSAT